MATISNTPRPGYVWDATDNCWYPIGTGPHSHADYITAGSAINPNIVDAKGDLIAATAADTVTRLAVGTDGQVLTAASTTGTGLAWTTISSSPSFVGCYAFAPNSNNQTVNDQTYTFINLESENFDTDGFHDTSTNTSRITIPSGKGGKYLVLGQVTLGGGSGFSGSGYRIGDILKNGTTNVASANAIMVVTTADMPTIIRFHTILDLAATDYIQMRVAHNQNASVQARGNGYAIGATFLSVQYLGA